MAPGVAKLSPVPYFRHNLRHFVLYHAGRDPVRMQAYVYKSQRKQDTYVYLARRDDFATMPAPLHAQLAPFTFVLEVGLMPERRLAQADAGQVRRQLAERGFFVQFPPSPLAAAGRDDD